ncbi:MAG: hypothetical protein J5848_00070 [Bacteroidales bacterium]|nr:hypothetical protein [Bacteroidales bacterium]
MKRFIIAIMLFAGLSASAQTGHLTFKGVPIDGTLSEFVGKLKQKGFTHVGSEQGVALLQGEFAAYKGCTVFVYEHQSGLVNRVGVMFPDRDTWSLLYSDYSNLKEMLTQKYGKPTEETEEFQTYSAPLDDNSRMFEVRMDRCKYICDFTTENGVIELRISHNSVISCFVVLLYVDAENESKVQSNAIDDL